MRFFFIFLKVGSAVSAPHVLANSLSVAGAAGWFVCLFVCLFSALGLVSVGVRYHCGDFPERIPWDSGLRLKLLQCRLGPQVWVTEEGEHRGLRGAWNQKEGGQAVGK